MIVEIETLRYSARNDLRLFMQAHGFDDVAWAAMRAVSFDVAERSVVISFVDGARVRFAYAGAPPKFVEQMLP